MVGAGTFAVVEAVTTNGTRERPTLARQRSTLARGEREPLTIAAGPGSYRVVYDVREPGRPTLRETIAVRRPYASRRVTATETQQTDFARLVIEPNDGRRTVLSPPPAAVDPRPALVAQAAVDHGLLERRERRRVLQRECQVYRSHSSVTSSTITAPLPREYTDICVAEDGLVLEEWQVFDGRALRQRIALEIQTGVAPILPITEAPTVDAARGGGSVREADATSEPVGRFFVLDSPPEGFTRRGRYAVVPPQAGLDDPEQRKHAVASTADVYERGGDVLVVDRGAALSADKAFEPRPEGRPVDLGPTLGEGELLLSWTGPEVRVALAEGKFVRVYGTVSVDTVVAVARALRETRGGTGLVLRG